MEVAVVSALSTGAGDINLTDATDVTVDTVEAVEVSRVRMDGTLTVVGDSGGQSDLRTQGGSIRLTTLDGR